MSRHAKRRFGDLGFGDIENGKTFKPGRGKDHEESVTAEPIDSWTSAQLRSRAGQREVELWHNAFDVTKV
jgi:hypothetical protein